MLVDFDPGPPDPRGCQIASILGESTALVRIGRGLYGGSVNAGNLLTAAIRDEYPFDPRHPSGATDDELRESWQVYLENVRERGWPPGSYGVSDSLEQVVERFPAIDGDPRPLAVIGSVVRRSDQPEHGGWRWHKWGAYIGEREPQYEYLHDEPDIDLVWVWHIYEINPTAVIIIADS